MVDVSATHEVDVRRDSATKKVAEPVVQVSGFVKRYKKHVAVQRAVSMRTFIVLFASVVAWSEPVFANDSSLQEFFQRRVVQTFRLTLTSLKAVWA